jgi:SAM-dependent methyltransferase
MRRQQTIWKKEHANNASIPKIGSTTPAGGAIYFADFLKKRGIVTPGNIVDIGCGKGRNTVYFAQLGYSVFGMDYIALAIAHTKKLIHQAGHTNHVKLVATAIDKKWPFPANYFDAAIDNYSSIDIETKKGRDIYKKELLRTLKPGGYALICVVSANDELEHDLHRTSPCEEIHSTIWPNGKFQKNYTEEELREFYREFDVVELTEIKKSAIKLGKTYMATNYRLIIQKPSL